MNHLLKDQVAIVTGGNAGIGKAIAQKYAEHGAQVIIFGTNAETGRETVQEINSKYPDSIHFFKVNVASTSEVESTIKDILQQFGKIDILVNNAGITRDQLLIKMSEADWDDVMAVNVKSCYNTSKAVVRSMMKARKGRIINMSSIVGLTGNPGQANYAASKAAMIGLTKALALELASRNILVNCIAPGFIGTRMTDVLTDGQKTELLQKIPLGRMGQPEEIAEVALFLGSCLSSYMTGQVLTVDGGMVM